MNLSLKIKGAFHQECGAASCFGGFWMVNTMVNMDHYVWITAVLTARVPTAAEPDERARNRVKNVRIGRGWHHRSLGRVV